MSCFRARTCAELLTSVDVMCPLFSLLIADMDQDKDKKAKPAAKAEDKRPVTDEKETKEGKGSDQGVSAGPGPGALSAAAALSLPDNQVFPATPDDVSKFLDTLRANKKASA